MNFPKKEKRPTACRALLFLGNIRNATDKQTPFGIVSIGGLSFAGITNRHSTVLCPDLYSPCFRPTEPSFRTVYSIVQYNLSFRRIHVDLHMPSADHSHRYFSAAARTLHLSKSMLITQYIRFIMTVMAHKPARSHFTHALSFSMNSPSPVQRETFCSGLLLQLTYPGLGGNRDTRKLLLLSPFYPP